MTQKDVHARLQAHPIKLKKVQHLKWKEIAQLPDLQDIPIGTLSNIMAGREPKDPILRAKLGYSPLEPCSGCWKFNDYIEEAVSDTRPKRRNIRYWRDYPTETLRLALKYREEI